MPTYIVCLIAALLIVFSCKPRTAAHAETDPATNEPAKTPGPSSQDLLEALRGRWQNVQDTAFYIQISDDLIAYFKNNVKQEEKRIEVSYDCRSAACRSDSLANTVGWCFSEISVANTQCFLVTRCDTLTLRFRVLGGSGEERSFKKM